MKTPEQRGPFGAWLVDQRQRLTDQRGTKVKQQDIVDELAAAGYPVDAAYYRALEGGSKKPGKDTREALARFFGQRPPQDQPAGNPDLGELVSAIREQTQAISELVLVLRERTDDEDSSVRAMVEALRHGARLVVEPPELHADTPA